MTWIVLLLDLSRLPVLELLHGSGWEVHGLLFEIVEDNHVRCLHDE